MSILHVSVGVCVHTYMCVHDQMLQQCQSNAFQHQHMYVGILTTDL